MVNFIFYLRILSYFVILSSIGGPCLPKPRRGLRSQAPDAFGLNLLSQLVLGYHWFVYLNRVLGFKNHSKVLNALQR